MSRLIGPRPNYAKHQKAPTVGRKQEERDKVFGSFLPPFILEYLGRFHGHKKEKSFSLAGEEKLFFFLIPTDISGHDR